MFLLKAIEFAGFTDEDNTEYFKTRRSLPFNILAWLRKALTMRFLWAFSIPWAPLPSSRLMSMKYVHGSSVRFFTEILPSGPCFVAFPKLFPRNFCTAFDKRTAAKCLINWVIETLPHRSLIFGKNLFRKQVLYSKQVHLFLSFLLLENDCKSRKKNRDKIFAFK